MSDVWSSGLVGRCFHIFGEGGAVDYEGVVRADLGDGNFLIQYFEAFSGHPNTCAIVHISRMIQPADNYRQPGAWQFYQDAEHLRDWWDRFGKYRKAA
jgi:hypothetical protein